MPKNFKFYVVMALVAFATIYAVNKIPKLKQIAGGA